MYNPQINLHYSFNGLMAEFSVVSHGGCIARWKSIDEIGCYADVIVHRLLSAALGLSNLPPQLRDRPTLTSVSDSRALILYSSNFYIGHLYERTSSKVYTLNISCGCNSLTGGQCNVWKAFFL